MRSSLVSLVAAGLAVLAVGCSGKAPPAPLADAGPLPAPTVASISPSSGPKSGGTTVSVLGTNFVDGAKLFIGGVEATQVTVISDLRLTGVTQVLTANGLVDVKVENPDGQSATLPSGFRVIPPPSERTDVDSCQLLSPQSLSIGEGSVTKDIVGSVTAIGVTDSPGQGGKITGQLGYAPSSAGTDLAAWTWVDATYGDAISGTAYDGYSAAIAAPAQGNYVYGFRFQYNGGNWTYCDLNGSDVGGFTADQLGHLSVGPPQVDWCNLQWPFAAISNAGQPATMPDGGATSADGPGLIYSHVYKGGVTNYPGQGAGITSQMGVGPADSGPGSAGWVWVDATYNNTCTSCNDGHDDEYEAQLVGPQYGGSYSYTFRYKVDGGDWTYCNQSGLITGDRTDGLGILTNTGPKQISGTVDWCNVETATASAQAGQASSTVTSQVYKQGVTETAGNQAQINGQMGIGPSNTTPVSTGWSWTTATFSASGVGSLGPSNYRYSASPLVGSAGTYSYAYRYQYGTGAWVYCDTAGVWDAGTANLGALTVTPPPAGNVQCALESLSAGAVASGSPLTAVAHVYAPNVTPGTGQGAGLITQVGVGAWGSAPAAAGWGWRTATYLDDSDAGATDRYTATVSPAYTGDRSVTFRVSADDGGTWTYCDQSQIPDAGYLSVGNYDTSTGIGYCNIQYPTPSNGGALTSAGTNVYGQIYAAGLTDGNDAGVKADPGLFTAQLGVGHASEDPGVSTNWTWANASFNSTSTTAGNNFEYVSPFPTEPSGSYNYAFRYTIDGGTWCYGDQNSGNTDGFSGSDIGTASIP